MPVSHFHVLQERARPDRLDPSRRDILKRMADAPKFVFSQDVIEFLADHEEEFVEAMKLAFAAGHTHLPHSPMLVEYEDIAEETPNRVFWLVEGGEQGASYKLLYSHINRSEAIMADVAVPVRVNSSGRATCASVDDTAQALFRGAVVALTYAMALHVRGIVTRPASPPEPRLDISRQKRRLPPITKDYVTVHIGYTTDRSGKKHDFVEGLGGHKRVHLRCGHIRNQPCGKGLQDRREVWISSVLVNYRPGVEVPDATYLVVP